MLVETIEDLEALKIEHGVQQASSLNIVITDGRCVVGLRYISKSHEQIPPPYITHWDSYVPVIMESVI